MIKINYIPDKPTAVLLIGLIITTSVILGKNHPPVITSIGLKQPFINQEETVPKYLSIGIIITANAYYKILSGSEIIKGGLFRKGLNTIDLDARDLLFDTGKHTYFLEIKTDQYHFRHKICVDIKLARKEFLTPDESSDSHPAIITIVRETGMKKIIHSKEFNPFDPKIPGIINVPSMNLSITGNLVPLVRLFLKKKKPQLPPPLPLTGQFQFSGTGKKSGEKNRITATVKISSIPVEVK